jgi:hypothetical protein
MRRNVPDIIPPRSVVELIRADASTFAWKQQIGRRFRVGYYNPNDGLDCIWLVNENGEYEQTTDRATLLTYFQIIKLSNERDVFGKQRRRLGRLASRTGKASKLPPRRSASAA